MKITLLFMLATISLSAQQKSTIDYRTFFEKEVKAEEVNIQKTHQLYSPQTPEAYRVMYHEKSSLYSVISKGKQDFFNRTEIYTFYHPDGSLGTQIVIDQASRQVTMFNSNLELKGKRIISGTEPIRIFEVGMYLWSDETNSYIFQPE